MSARRLALLGALILAFTLTQVAGVGAEDRLASASQTPYMGWNTYYGVGGVFDEQTILSVARSLLEDGLTRAGYRIVWLDYGWASGERNRDGEIVTDRRQ